VLDRRRKEVELVEATYGEVELGPDLSWIVIRRWQLPAGWNKANTAVLVNIPAGYPVTPPDNFCTDPDLRLANGSMPGNVMGVYEYAGHQWLQFSFHVVDSASEWHPHAELLDGHNLLTFLTGVKQRLEEAS
jgi:hypothetical protein